MTILNRLIQHSTTTTTTTSSSNGSSGNGSASSTKSSNGIDITTFDVGYHHLLNNNNAGGSRCNSNSNYNKFTPTTISSAMQPTTQPTILACSSGMSSSSSSSQVHKLLSSARREFDGKPLCIHRKGFFDHLKPRAFVTSTLRVATQQGTLVMANFMTEQLQGDLERTKLVEDNKLTQLEADEQADEWEKIEWEKRWQAYPKKFFVAFAKYHAVTLVMRLYESIADHLYDKITLDKLTMDTFYASKKIASGSEMNLSSSLKRSSSSSSDASSSFARGGAVGGISNAQQIEVARTMFNTSMWANVIAFLADYSVHQVILCYGYYVYIKERRKRLKSQQEQEQIDGTATTTETDVAVGAEVAGAISPGSPTTNKQKAIDDEILDHGAIFTSFVKKSTRLFVSRGIGLVFCSCGSSVGTVLYPGWGTLLFANMGEGAAGVILEESKD